MDILVFQPMSERIKMKCVSVECFVARASLKLEIPWSERHTRSVIVHTKTLYLMCSFLCET
jgi:hypothetical protein